MMHQIRHGKKQLLWTWTWNAFVFFQLTLCHFLLELNRKTRAVVVVVFFERGGTLMSRMFQQQQHHQAFHPLTPRMASA